MNCEQSQLFITPEILFLSLIIFLLKTKVDWETILKIKTYIYFIIFFIILNNKYRILNIYIR